MPVDPNRLPHGEDHAEAERMIADLLASEEVSWVDAPDLFDLPSHIQYLIEQATAPLSLKHRQEVREAIASRRNRTNSALSRMASTLATTKIAFLPVEVQAWTAHLELKRYRDWCKSHHCEMLHAASVYFKERPKHPEPIPGRPDEWGPRSDALRYAALQKLGYKSKEAGKKIGGRHLARIKQLTTAIPDGDVDVQAAMEREKLQPIEKQKNID